jgi:hypothetical protein
LMQKTSERASGYRFQVSGLALLVLVLAFACFGCGGERARDASGGEEGAGKTEAGSEDTNDPSVQVRAPAGAGGDVDHYRVDCRMQTHIFKEEMSRTEARDFKVRVAYRVQANLNGGDDKNLGDILDDLDVPDYKGLCG